VKPSDSESTLARFFARSNVIPGAFTVREMVEVVIDFYRSQRASGLERGPETDMLLFQWGTYDRGDGSIFSVGIVRQFTSRQLFDDPVLSQLHVTATFEPCEFFDLSSSHFWCHSVDESAEFRERILATSAYLRTADLRPRKSEIRWELV